MGDARRLLLAAGDQLGGYRVLNYVASGGMAEVYHACDLSSQQAVALKVIPPELAHDKQLRDRFLRESREVTGLCHPNIIPIYGAGDDRDALFLAMRHVDPNGYARADLRAVLDKEGALPPKTALWILAQVADALDVAHSRGLVHRDVTPHNILIERGDGRLDDSRVYLTDFGITRRLASTSTRTTGFVGTLHYAAPEQIRNEPPHPCSDLYALGCVAFEMLTTQPPYHDYEDTAALIFAILGAPIPKLTAPPSHRFAKTAFPAAVDAVLERALAKDPAARFSTAGELVTELAGALLPDEHLPVATASHWHRQQTPAQEPTTPRRRRRDRSADRLRRRWRWLAAGGLLATAAVAALLVATGLTPGTGGSSRYPGHRPEAPFALTHPASWRQHLQPNSFVLFAPQDLRGLFTGQPTAWPQVIKTMQSDPARLVGLYARVDNQPSAPDSTDILQTKLGRELPGSRISWEDTVQDRSVAGRPTLALRGKMRPPDSTDALQIRAVVVPLTPAQTAHLIFFAPGLPSDPSVFDQQQEAFNRVLGSLTLPAAAAG